MSGVYILIMWEDHAPGMNLSAHASLEGAKAGHPGKVPVEWTESPAADGFPQSWEPVGASLAGDYVIEYWEVQP